MPYTLVTVLLLLFRPLTFAKRLRVDEPIWPSIATLVLAAVLCSPTYLALPIRNLDPAFLFESVARLSTMVGWVGMLIVISAFLLSFLAIRRQSHVWTFRNRFRFWCMVLMYSTPFLSFWWFTGADTRVLQWTDYVTEWPYVRMFVRDRAYYTGLYLLWWTFVVCAVVWRRHRPRWSAIPLFVFVYFFVRYSVQAADMILPRLSR